MAELNTAADGSPISQSLALHPASETVAAEAPDCACPFKIERLARIQSGCGMQSIYDSAAGCLCVEPLKTQSSLREWLQWQLSLPDDLLMSYASTSPEHEHPNFAEGEAQLGPSLHRQHYAGRALSCQHQLQHQQYRPCNKKPAWLGGSSWRRLLAAHDCWQEPVSSAFCKMQCVEC